MKTIKIYSTKSCAFCHAEKQYLKSKGIAYEEILVDKSGTMGVPFTLFTDETGNEEKMLGFDKKKLDQILSIV
jgi:hypothetical protein